MTDLTLSDTQAAAVKKLSAWFSKCRAEMRDKKPLSQQVFRIFGFAGCGKTTTLKYAMQELGAEAMPHIEKRDRYEITDFDDPEEKPHDGPPKVMYAAYTGKAALVMTRKGTPASTIHSMCYRVVEPTREAIEKARETLAKLLAKGSPEDPSESILWRAQIRDRENQIKNMHRPSFILNLQSPALDADLIVLDEVSMVGEEMAADLMSFKRPILVLGDPGQLPPIKGEGAFTQATPDILLTEIHRQAGDSAIIRLATLAREGRMIPFGQHSDLVWKIRRSELPLEWLAQADQVLCGFNASRFMLNNEIKRHLGQPDVFPTEASKVICLKNQSANGLINGCFLKLSEIGEPKEFGFKARVTTEDGVDTGEHTIYRGHFDDHAEFDKDRGQRDYWHKKGLVECTYGYAITVHKSQGSQWSNVALFDDGFGRGPDRAKWLYTACTRAESGLLIAA